MGETGKPRSAMSIAGCRMSASVRRPLPKVATVSIHPECEISIDRRQHRLRVSRGTGSSAGHGDSVGRVSGQILGALLHDTQLLELADRQGRGAATATVESAHLACLGVEEQTEAVTTDARTCGLGHLHNTSDHV